MNNTQLPFLAEGLLVLAAAVFGFLLDRRGKPFGPVKVIIHLFFFAWFSVGFGFIFAGVLSAKTTAGIPALVAVMGAMILAQLATGIVMLASKRVGKALPMVHLASAIVLLLADVTAFFLAGSS